MYAPEMQQKDASPGSVGHTPCAHTHPQGSRCLGKDPLLAWGQDVHGSDPAHLHDQHALWCIGCMVI